MPTQSESSAANDSNDIDHVSSPETSNQVDSKFENPMEPTEGEDVFQMVEAVKRNLEYFNAVNNRVYNSTVNFINEHKLWGTYYPEQKDYEFAENRAHAFVEHREGSKRFHQVLGGYRPRRILVSTLYCWLTSDPERIDQIYDKIFSRYFDLDIVKCNKDEVFVSVGGLIGDTPVSYVQTFENDCYKELYCYEITPVDIRYIEKNIELFHIDHVETKEKDASDRNGMIYLPFNELSSINQLSESGEITVLIAKIGDDIRGDVTFVKINVGGGEEKALLGCLGKMKKNYSKFALSVYHNYKDPWRLTRVIYEANPPYHSYLRYYGSPVFPTEYILYAI